MPKVALLTTEFAGEPTPGGIGTYVHYLSMGLEALRVDTDIICVSNRAGSESISERRQLRRVVPTPVLSSNSAARLPYSHYAIERSIAIWKELLLVSADLRFDVLDLADHLAIGFWNAMSAWIPMIVRVQTPVFLLQLKETNNIPAGFDTQLLQMLETYALKKSNALIGASDVVLAEVKRISQLDSPSHIQRNPIKLDEYNPKSNYSISGSNCRFLFVGRLERRKGVHVLLDAFEKALKCEPRMELCIVGTDTSFDTENSSVRKQLEEQAHALGISSKLVFKGLTSLDDLRDCYGSTDAVVVPSLFDNAPYTCVAGMAAGLPVIGTDGGGMPEYLENGKTGLIVGAGNADELSSAIVNLATDTQLRETLGSGARRFAELNCDHIAVAKRSLEIYESLGNLDSVAHESGYRRALALREKVDSMLRSMDQWIEFEIQMRCHYYDDGYETGLRDGAIHAVNTNLLTRAAHKLSGQLP
jgi:glycosyltransferase involved in cell wall biosynthesis